MLWGTFVFRLAVVCRVCVGVMGTLTPWAPLRRAGSASEVNGLRDDHVPECGGVTWLLGT